MFNRILVAYDGSPESKRALLTGIDLAKSLNAELRAVSVIENLPPFAGYADVRLPDPTQALREQAAVYYRKIQGDAQQASQQEGVVLMTEVVEGDEVQAIVECARRTRSDLLVVGVHRHSSLFSRLLNHTTQDLSQWVASSILSVH
jgi:nucleotide-binding universal stress UspA family protein